MLENEVFYHGITRKTIAAFGSLFNDVQILRVTPSTADVPKQQLINVPISYAPRDKMLARVNEDSSIGSNTHTSLPRMSFEITGFTYDPARKTNRSSPITCGGVNGVTRTYSPMPYNIDISLYAISKNTEDGLQIVEQIIPFFSPELTMTINAVEGTNINMDIPIILNTTSVEDDYEGEMTQHRFVTWTFTFTIKTYMFGPMKDSGVITAVMVNNFDIENVSHIFSDYQVDGDENTGTIASEEWTEY